MTDTNDRFHPGFLTLDTESGRSCGVFGTDVTAETTGGPKNAAVGCVSASPDRG